MCNEQPVYVVKISYVDRPAKELLANGIRQVLEWIAAFGEGATEIHVTQ